MSMTGECLGCGVDFDYAEDACPECGWEPAGFRERGRHGLAKEGHGEPESDSGTGPPPGPDSLLGL